MVSSAQFSSIDWLQKAQSKKPSFRYSQPLSIWLHRQSYSVLHTFEIQRQFDKNSLNDLLDANPNNPQASSSSETGASRAIGQAEGGSFNVNKLTKKDLQQLIYPGEMSAVKYKERAAASVPSLITEEDINDIGSRDAFLADIMMSSKEAKVIFFLLYSS